MEEKNVLFIVPDGVGVRNYLYSKILKNPALHKAKLFLWTTLPDEAFHEIEKSNNVIFNKKKIILQKEPFFTKIYRESATYARLIYNAKLVANPTIMSNWSKQNRTSKQKTGYIIAEIIGKWASKKYNRILWLEKKSRNFYPKKIINTIKKDLLKINPTSIFITHQRVASLMPICIAAKELNIKVITVIYSWDNLPKARLAVMADQYLVWSENMKIEMQSYYPEISDQKIIVTGTPQFEFYREKERIISRELFAQKHDLDFTKKWICFSGDDILTSPFDPIYLSDVAEAINTISPVKRPQIIFRKCPADLSDRYDAVINKFPEIIKSIDPIWHNAGNWGSNFPKSADIDLLVNLAFHCNLVLNLGSTMAFDFSFFDKPCLYFKYNPEVSAVWNVETIYNFQHFRTMNNLDVVVWINNKEEIQEKIMNILDAVFPVAIDKKKWAEMVVMHPIENSATLIANTILN